MMPDATYSFEAVRKEYAERVGRVLCGVLQDDEVPSMRLKDAMGYSTLGDGKRFRAMLVYAAGEMFGTSLDALDAAACAVEMVHAYSLIHDDLPAMDNDALRRGKPTCHIRYDEAHAILAGDALQSLALEILASERLNPGGPSTRIRMVEILVRAIGWQGMAAGQSLDMQFAGQRVGADRLARMLELKTGALIEASVMLGGTCALGPEHDYLRILSAFGKSVGLIFQIKDDILDTMSDSETLGKDAGSDERMNKTTSISTMGIEDAQCRVAGLLDSAIGSLGGMTGDGRFLADLARFAAERKY